MTIPQDNPYLNPSPLPLQYPPFDQIRAEHHLPAFRAGMEQQLEQVRAIVQDPDLPTFENTIEPFERSGEILTRVSDVFFNVIASDSTDELRAVEEEVAPLLAAHSDAINLDPAIFARVDSLLHDDVQRATWTPEQTRLVERHHRDLVRAGAALEPAQQDRLRQINDELSRLGASFNTHLLAEAADHAVHVTDPDQLTGLDDARIAAARQAAQARGLAGHLLTMVLPTDQPVLESLTDRGLRQRVHEASITRGQAGEHDVRGIVVKVVQLRAERAKLLGFDTYADYVAADETAGTNDAVTAMLDRLTPAAVRNARREAEELGSLLTADGVPGGLEPWDWAFYADQVRRERFEVNTDALKPYFELGRVVQEGVFRAATELYGITFRRRTDLPTYHRDVEVYDVLEADGSQLGLFLADWYARDSKRGGAWMSSFVDQSELLGQRPVIVINLNVPKPPPGEPTLMTLDEVVTAFHEFGHVLHGLFSAVTYPTFSGTNTPRDFVEYPSQVNEMWAFHPDVLPRYARHHVTGEALPADTVQRIIESRSYGEGFATTEYLGAALLDQEWHRLSPEQANGITAGDVLAFEADALKRRGVAFDKVPPRYRTTYFAHIFASGYAAAYYAYIWSEVLDADTVAWFEENGGLNRANGDRFRQAILAVGGSVDPLEAFAGLRGRAPDVGPLLRRRGLE